MIDFNEMLALRQKIETEQRLLRESGRMNLIMEEVKRNELLVREMGLLKSIEDEIHHRRKIERELYEELIAVRGPVQEHIRHLSEEIERAREDSLKEFLRAKRIAYEAAASPILGDLAYTAYSNIAGAVGRLNAAVAGAFVIGEFEVQEEGEEDAEASESAETQGSTLEEQLVTVVPADVLSHLKSVDFFPLSALDEILRSPDALRYLSARDFERFTATLIDHLGFEDVTITPRSGDQGRDVLAVKRVHGISILFAFECKRYKPDNPVGPDILRALLGTIRHGRTEANKGVLVTTSTFTSGARNYLLMEPALDGKDFEGIVGWLKEYADKSKRGNA